MGYRSRTGRDVPAGQLTEPDLTQLRDQMVLYMVS